MSVARSCPVCGGVVRYKHRTYCGYKCYLTFARSRKPICHPDRKHFGRNLCNECYRRSEFAKTNYAKYSKSHRKVRRNQQLVREFGITLEQYNQLLTSQGSRCAICKKLATEQPKALAVDHCHETGRIRGLLCTMCNTGIGKFNDDPAMLGVAAEYLRNALGSPGTIA